MAPLRVPGDLLRERERELAAIRASLLPDAPSAPLALSASVLIAGRKPV